MADKVTIYDVAEQAGVSPSTVSRVLNKSQRVAAPTRQRVMTVIERLHYEPDRLARMLAGRIHRGQQCRVGDVSVEFSGRWAPSEIKALLEAIAGLEEKLAPDVVPVSWVCQTHHVEHTQLYLAVRLHDDPLPLVARSADDLVAAVAATMPAADVAA